MEYSIEILKNMFSQLQWDDKKYKEHSNIIRFIEKIVEGENIVNIYPKNMFSDDINIEFYIFTDKNIFKTKRIEGEGGYISTEVVKLEDIKKIEKTEGDEYGPISLKICFYDGEEYIFNSKSDTNTHHSYKYKEVINEIIKYLLKRA